jgi:hypothetical protein
LLTNFCWSHHLFFFIDRLLISIKKPLPSLSSWVIHYSLCEIMATSSQQQQKPTTGPSSERRIFSQNGDGQISMATNSHLFTGIAELPPLVPAGPMSELQPRPQFV